jgi:site-specific recombinase XerD
MPSTFIQSRSPANTVAQLEMEAALADAVGQLSPSSRRTYTIDAHQFARWMLEHTITPATMTRSHAIAYRAYLQDHYAKATAARKLVVARRLLEEQRKQGKLAANPFDDVKGFTVENETTHVVLKEEQAQTLLESIDTTTLRGLRDYVLLLFLFAIYSVGGPDKAIEYLCNHARKNENLTGSGC